VRRSAHDPWLNLGIDRSGGGNFLAEIHHFAYGWISPTLAFVMSFLGSLLGLVLAGRARESTGFARARWLALAAVAIGGTGIWLMHFMAMIGFDIPRSIVRYDVPMTVTSLGIAIVIVSLGLFTIGFGFGFGRMLAVRIVFGGFFTGLGVAAMHYTGMAAVRTEGRLTYDMHLVVLSVVIAVAASTVALWFAAAVRGASATVGAALLMGLAVCSMHYTAMAAVHVRLDDTPVQAGTVGPFVLLTPIAVLACVMITALGYASIGSAVHQENQREEDILARTRDGFRAAATSSLHPFH
jgi:NO-binding membrane sensor protein with MHYT domain